MRNVLKATGHGLKHFFGARESRDDYKSMGRAYKRGNKVRKAEVLATMGMYAVYKGSPIGLAKNIYDSIKVGTWKYGDIRNHQNNVEEVLAQTNMSDEGKRTIAKLVQAGGSADMEADLSVADAAEFKRLENELHIAAGNCINF